MIFLFSQIQHYCANNLIVLEFTLTDGRYEVLNNRGIGHRGWTHCMPTRYRYEPAG